MLSIHIWALLSFCLLNHKKWGGAFWTGGSFLTTPFNADVFNQKDRQAKGQVTDKPTLLFHHPHRPLSCCISAFSLVSQWIQLSAVACATSDHSILFACLKLQYGAFMERPYLLVASLWTTCIVEGSHRGHRTLAALCGGCQCCPPELNSSHIQADRQSAFIIQAPIQLCLFGAYFPSSK